VIRKAALAHAANLERWDEFRGQIALMVKDAIMDYSDGASMTEVTLGTADHILDVLAEGAGDG
jgi:hypothetical protein